MAIDVSILSTLAPLNSVTRQHQMDIADKTVIESVGMRQFLFKNGDTDNKHVYLVSGTVELIKADKVVKVINADIADNIRQPLAHSQPRAMSCRTATHCKIIRIDSNMLDVILTWNQTGTYQVDEVTDISNGDNIDDWMVRVVKSKPFAHIPPANIQALFMQMEMVETGPGVIIVKQGTPGEHFFVINSGKAVVLRATKKNPKGIKLAELKEGDSFGEDAILAECNRNATVVMLTKGSVIRIPKKDFLEYLKAPQVEKVSINEALKLQSQGAILIDVRLPDECKVGILPGAVNIPLVFLRMKLPQLDKSKEYIVYCDTGRRSTNGCYLMREGGFSVKWLTSGVTSHPDLLQAPE